MTEKQFSAEDGFSHMNDTTLYSHIYESSLGPLLLVVDRRGWVYRVSFSDSYEAAEAAFPDVKVERNRWACGELAYQLDEYFRGKVRKFSVEPVFRGTPFQLDVWNRLRKIPYGTTVTYGQVAQKIGRKGAARAVGNAVALNPIPIIVPCHRIIPASGGIGSYSGGGTREEGKILKKRLLNLESALPGGGS